MTRGTHSGRTGEALGNDVEEPREWLYFLANTFFDFSYTSFAVIP